jgi:hypothetical protein
LCSLGLAKDLHELFSRIANEPDSGFLFPACIRFFAHLALADPSALSRFPRFLDSVFDLVFHFDLLDAPQRALAFDTLALVASVPEGRRILSQLDGMWMLHEQWTLHRSNLHTCMLNWHIVCEYSMNMLIADGTRMTKAMARFGAAATSGPLELRVRHLDALHRLFSPCTVDPTSPAMRDDAVLEEWFAQLGEPFPTILIAYLHKPFVELRHASLALLLVLVEFPWAQSVFAKTDRSVHPPLSSPDDADSWNISSIEARRAR